MADFTGFYFNNQHSSAYGLIRTSDGDRYKEGLIPEFDDYEIERVGGDGDLYEGRRYKKTTFTVPIAFDHMTEQQFRDLRKWLGGDSLKEFRFDDRPYKAYWAKLASRPELEYICFLELKDDAINADDKERIYKGEGQLEFVAYDPFGYCNDNSWKLEPWGREDVKDPSIGINWQIVTDTYVPFTVVDLNEGEWAEVSGLKNDMVIDANNNLYYNEFYYPPKEEDGAKIYTAYLYNPGDFETDFQLLFDFGRQEKEIENQSLVQIILSNADNAQYYHFVFDIKGLKDFNTILMNTKNHSLTVYKIEEITENDTVKKIITDKSLRYDLVKSTDWPKIPQEEWTMEVRSIFPIQALTIKYNYKYY